MRVLVPGLFVLCVCVPVSGAPVPKERAEAERIVGTWKMTLDSQGGTDVDLEIEFQQGGKMVIRQVMQGGQVSEFVGTYRVVGNELPYEVKQGTRLKAETLTIKKLTANELIVVDSDGLKEEFARKEPPQKIDPAKLVGRWEQVRPKVDVAFVVEYGADGKVTGEADAPGRAVKIAGTYKLDGNKLLVTLKGAADKAETSTSVITKLTDDEMVGVTPGGDKMLMKRVKEKGKK
ncbi:MAG: TIGR03066 family protein [Planctomycetes bacterium]|nr:TIGR03066 family protein [Planctomycetota bacterium]